MKQIVSKEQITTDPCLTLVKAFRIANKRAGEAKKELIAYSESRLPATPQEAESDEDRPVDAEEARLIELYKSFCSKLTELAQKAETMGFHIWVNYNGVTGHTYTKDYKVTTENDNNYEAHAHKIAMEQAAVSQMLGGPGVN